MAAAVTGGCQWAIQELRAEDYGVRKANAIASYQEAGGIKALVCDIRENNLPPKRAAAAIDKLADCIRERAVDEVDRADVGISGTGVVVEPLPDPKSPRTNANFNALAGVNKNREVKRRKIGNALSPAHQGEKVVHAVWRRLPWWIQWPLIVSTVITLLAFAWGRWSAVRLRSARAELEALRARAEELKQACIEYDNEIEHHMGDRRAEIGHDRPHLQREHVWINTARKDARRIWAESLMPGLDEPCHMDALGEEARHRPDTDATHVDPQYTLPAVHDVTRRGAQKKE